jgi:hypothetical protein
MNQMCGLMASSLQHSIRVAMTAHLSLPRADPANRAFFRAFDSVVVQINTTVIEKARNAIPSGEGVLIAPPSLLLALT